MYKQLPIWILVCASSAHLMTAQTRLDLRTQSKSPDLSSLGATKTLQTGPALPAACNQGEVFFSTSAQPGQNFYGCVSTNTWALMSGGSGTTGTGSGTLSIKTDNGLVGSSGFINFLSAPGSTVTGINDGTNINVTLLPDTAYLSTRTNIQSGIDTYCASSSGSSTTYTCAEPNTVSAYTDGMRLLWKPDVSCTAGSQLTLNVDANGPANIYQNDGVTSLSVSQCVAGSQALLAYSAALNGGIGAWRLLSGSGAGVGGGTKTSPNETWYSSAWANAGTASGQLWYGSSSGTTLNSYGGTSGSGLTGVSLGKTAGGSTWFFVTVPQSWTGSMTIKVYYTLTGSAAGTVNLAVSTACFTAPIPLGSALTFNAFGTIADTFNTGDSAGGKFDTVNGTPSSCSPGQLMAIKFQRQNSGTAPDDATLFGAYVSLPFTM